jgi:hypothetical protein
MQPAPHGGPPSGAAVESRFLNTLLHYISEHERFNAEMAEARKEFEQMAGGIMENVRDYLARINSFHNWYILDRPLRSLGITPLAYFLEFNANSFSQEELNGYRELGQNLHSVFELSKRTRTQTWLRDLVTGKKYGVEGSEETNHIDPGAIFNSRLFEHSGKWYFSNYLVPHPANVAKEIRKAAKRVRKAKADPKAFLFRLVFFQSRWNQYRQFDSRNIYRFEE